MDSDTPNPGSDEAIDQGCTCPVIDNGHGRGSYKGDGFIISGDCPVHAIEELDWEMKAKRNVEKWGEQTPLELILALQEEMGELAESYLAYAEGEYPDWAKEVLQLQSDAGTVAQRELQSRYEDDDGVPLDDRPSLDGGLEVTHEVGDELDDLAALCYQLRDSLEAIE